MRRIKSAPANIAEMINRKKEYPKTKKTLQITIPLKKKQSSIIIKEEISPLRNQKNIEKTFNNIMLDYIDDKQIYNINDEQAVFIGIIYFYVCEKIFIKKNLREFILFVMQIFIRYFIGHSLNDLYINNHDLINEKLLLINEKLLLINEKLLLLN